ncbi:pectin lyase fold/virulence factor [Rhizoctonia solani]|nr:pectin lyase fold/virulence factor [Rhizoctonia solani]
MLLTQLLQYSLLASFWRLSSAGYMSQKGSNFVITPGDQGADDSQAIIDAFKQCGHNGHIEFQNVTYHIERVVNTTELAHCTVDIKGTLLWGTDIQYWLNNSLPIGYQKQSSAWFLGGKNLRVRGFGYGTIDGNWQIWWVQWYDYTKGIPNIPDKPHSLTIWKARNSVFEGLRFVQSQMCRSKNGYPARNTDGADAIASNRITFRGWEVENADDGIVARNITCIGTRYAARIKTWTGIQQGYPPNGGSGGTGVIRNITWKDFHLIDITLRPVEVTQCISYSGATGGCNTSTFQISNITLGPMTGNSTMYVLAGIQCSSAAPCQNIPFDNTDGIKVNGTEAKIKCSNVTTPIGLNVLGACKR